MTEQHTSFGGLAVADPRSPVAPVASDDAADSASRRKLAIVGAVAAVLVVFVAAFFLMKGNGSDNTAATVPPHVVPPASSSTTTHSGTSVKPAAAVHLPKVYTGTVGRDPFKALYVQPKDTGSGTNAAGNGTSTSTTTTVPSGTPTDGTTAPTTGSTGTTTTPTTPVFRPIWVKLLKLTSTGAVFDVGFSDHKNLKVHRYDLGTPKAGSPIVFARNFAFLRMTGGSVMLQYGDGTPFVLDAQHNVMIVN